MKETNKNWTIVFISCSCYDVAKEWTGGRVFHLNVHVSEKKHIKKICFCEIKCISNHSTQMEIIRILAFIFQRNVL